MQGERRFTTAELLGISGDDPNSRRARLFFRFNPQTPADLDRLVQANERHIQSGFAKELDTLIENGFAGPGARVSDEARQAAKPVMEIYVAKFNSLTGQDASLEDLMGNSDFQFFVRDYTKDLKKNRVFLHTAAGMSDEISFQETLAASVSAGTDKVYAPNPDDVLDLNGQSTPAAGDAWKALVTHPDMRGREAALLKSVLPNATELSSERAAQAIEIFASSKTKEEAIERLGGRVGGYSGEQVYEALNGAFSYTFSYSGTRTATTHQHSNENGEMDRIVQPSVYGITFLGTSDLADMTLPLNLQIRRSQSANGRAHVDDAPPPPPPSAAVGLQQIGNDFRGWVKSYIDPIQKAGNEAMNTAARSGYNN